jgi:hypothetical protein
LTKPVENVARAYEHEMIGEQMAELSETRQAVQKPVTTFKARDRVIWSRTKQKGTYLGLGSHGATVDFGAGRNGGIKQYIPLAELRLVKERKKENAC